MDARYKPVIWYCPGLGGWAASFWFSNWSTDPYYEERKLMFEQAKAFANKMNQAHGPSEPRTRES